MSTATQDAGVELNTVVKYALAASNGGEDYFGSKGAPGNPPHMPTADRVRELLRGAQLSAAELEIMHEIEQDTSVIDDAIASVAELSKSNYREEMLKMIARERITWKDIGYAASIAKLYADTAPALTTTNQTGNGNHYGTVKQRYNVTLSVTFIREIPGQYGTTRLVKGVTDTGELCAWFASTNPDVRKGDVLELVATVKDHTQYQGNAQTVLTRCKISTVNGGAPRD